MRTSISVLVTALLLLTSCAYKNKEVDLVVRNAHIVSMDGDGHEYTCLLYTSPSPRDRTRSRMPSSA